MMTPNANDIMTAIEWYPFLLPVIQSLLTDYWAGIQPAFSFRESKMKIIPNPNEKEWDEATAAVIANGGYCPCKPMKTPDTLCICKEFREGECGPCQCGRFITVER